MGILTNSKLVGAMLISGLLQLGTILIPWGRHIFATSLLSPSEWALVFAASLVPITVVEVSKLLRPAHS
jgi:hypothetical protein